MKNSIIIYLLVMLNFSVFGQLKGIVKDSVSGAPISYVSISVENEKYGTTSEENGEFSLSYAGKSKRLVFYAMGYEGKTVQMSENLVVRLKPIAFQLDEVIIAKRLDTRQKEIGRSETEIHEAFENAPRIVLKYFGYLPEYKKTKYLKQVSVVTDSKIDDASFKIHFYGVDDSGAPSQELLEKDFIISVDKGVSKTRFNLSKFGLQMPKNGIFIGFEKLMISKNRLEKSTFDPVKKVSGTQHTYYPLMLYDNVEREFQFVYEGGNWIKKSMRNPEDQTQIIKSYEPAMTLILTN